MTGLPREQRLFHDKNSTFFIKKIFHMHNFVFSDELVEGTFNIF